MPLLPKEKAAEELAERGLTVVPRAVHGVTVEQILPFFEITSNYSTHLYISIRRHGFVL